MAKDARKIPHLTSTDETDSHISCMNQNPKILFVGNIMALGDKRIPKDKPLLLYSCPCLDCLGDLEAMEIF